MRKAAGLLLIGALALPGYAVAQPVEQSLLAPQPLHILPFQLYDGRLYVEAGGPGFSGRIFLLDSGAQLTHVTAELGREAGLRSSGRIGINGTGLHRVEGSYVALDWLDLGGARLPLARAIAAPADALFGSIFAGSGKRFDGVIGYDLFAAYVVEIDYEAGQIRLYDPASFTFPAQADVVPIRLVDRKPYITASFSLGGDSLPGDFLLDTGAGGALGFSGDFVAEQRLIERAGRTLPSSSRGIGGATPARLGRVQSLLIGRTMLPGPLATFSLAQGRGVRADAAGRIGGALLRRFTVTFHYAAQAIGLVPNSNFGRLLETDMSGLALLSSEGKVLVNRVAEESPAIEAGLRAGDRLMALDGRPAAELSLEAIRAMLIEHGRTRVLEIEREGRTLSIPILLRRRI
jgi:hypothetical protein